MIKSRTGEEWPLEREDFAELQKVFEGMDVLAELKKAQLWLKKNRARRKTRAGMDRFLFDWLQRENNRGTFRRSSTPQPARPRNAFDDYDAEIEVMEVVS